MSTKIFLRRLSDMGTFNLLQDKLSRLNDTYLVSVINNNRRNPSTFDKGTYGVIATLVKECLYSKVVKCI